MIWQKYRFPNATVLLGKIPSLQHLKGLVCQESWNVSTILSTRGRQISRPGNPKAFIQVSSLLTTSSRVTFRNVALIRSSHCRNLDIRVPVAAWFHFGVHTHPKSIHGLEFTGLQLVPCDTMVDTYQTGDTFPLTSRFEL